MEKVIRSEGVTLITEINAFIKEAQESPLPLLQCQHESAVCNLKSAFTKTRLHWNLDLEFQPPEQ